MCWPRPRSPHDALDVGGAGRQFDAVRVAVEHALHGVAQLQRPPDSLRTLIVGRGRHGKEGNVHTPFLKSRQIDGAPWAARPQIHILSEYPLQCVHVTIHAKAFSLDLARARHVLAKREPRQQKQQE
jgi:hypothetical protein